jgi:DNA-nicking Smr family endonuclease
MPRRLGHDEKALWGKVMATVKPLHRVDPPRSENGEGDHPKGGGGAPAAKLKSARVAGSPPSRATRAPPPRSGEDTLDSHWDRRIHRGGIVPDISIDLHDSNLSRAYVRLDGALEQAIAQKFKVILLVTGKPRAHDRASGEGRGAIAAVVRDWLAASRHARHISAVRNAHPKHGGAGALYIMLKG